MSTKRRIPINNHGPGAAETPEPEGPRTEAGTQGAVADAPEGGVSGAAENEQNEAVAADLGTAALEEAVAGAVAVDEVAAERDQLNDSLLRLRADFDNFRRRSARELIESRERAQGELLRDLLPVLDNLERALDAAEHHDEGKVLGGVRMTRDMFIDLLRRAGVEEIETVGAEFDPAVHDATLLQPSDQDEGIVTAVLERGYRQGDRILRPARVIVSSGPEERNPAETAG